MKRNDWQLLVNTLLFVDISSTAVLGLLLAFVIPSGNGPHGEKHFLGLYRHAWSDFHLYLSLTLIVLLVVHLWLNWTWVAQMTRKYFGEQWKRALCWLSCAWLPVLIIGWILIKLS